MRRSSKVFGWLVSLPAIGLGAASQLQASTSVTVPNFSFENPPVTSPTTVALSTDSWTLGQNGTLFNVGTVENPVYLPIGAGVFINPADPGGGPPMSGPYSNGHLDGADGTQLAYIYNNSGNTISQTLTDTFIAGQKYTLTASLAGAEASPPAGDKILMELYYVDPTTQQPVVVSSRNVDAAELSQTTVLDFSTTTGVIGSGAGQPINIFFAAEPAVNNPTASQFDLDNVRLTYAVPEPASLSLLGVGAMLITIRRRRAR